MRPRRVAIIGARGVANYGGFETVVSELAPRLCEKGYDVLLSHRRSGAEGDTSVFKGAHIVYFPFFFPKSGKMGRVFEVFYDSYFVIRFSLFDRCDAIYCLGIASGPILLIARPFGVTTIVNLDGLEWRRTKFSLSEKIYIKLAFLASYVGANKLVLDNRQLEGFLPSRSKAKSVFIPYGVTPRGCPKWNPAISSLNANALINQISANDYWLVVARLEPENNIHTMVRAYLDSDTKKPLLIVGSFSSPRYEALVRSLIESIHQGKSVLFLGSIHDQDALNMLRCHCFAYLHGHSVGGTNPSLLEAMSVGNLIVAHDNVFNREVAGSSAFYFKEANELALVMDSIEKHEVDYSGMGERASAIAKQKYRWDEVADAYDRLFRA